MYLRDALKERSRFSADVFQQPAWLSLSEDQIRAARHINSESFLSSKKPFEDDAYKNINYPFNLGKIQDTNAVVFSEAYDNARGARYFWYMRGCQLPGEFSYLQGVCEQYDLAHQILYGQDKVLWHMQTDTKMLYPGDVHRRTRQQDIEDCAIEEEPFHVDQNLDCGWIIDEMRADIVTGGHALKINEELFIVDDVLVKATGVPSTFLSVFATPEKGCLTEFKNATIPFGNWDILHFVAEPHRSPTIPIQCKRFLIQGIARPIVAEPVPINKAIVLNAILKQAGSEMRINTGPFQNNCG